MSNIKYHVIEGLSPPSYRPAAHATETDGFVYSDGGSFGRNLERPDDPLPETIEAQTEQDIAEHDSAPLRSLGLGLENILSVRVFLTRFKTGLRCDECRLPPGIFKGKHAPPSETCVGVNRSCARRPLIEIDCGCASANVTVAGSAQEAFPARRFPRPRGPNRSGP